jgi:hypothetical protein
MLEPESLIQAFDERRRRAVVRGWTVGTSSWIAALIAVWWLKSSASPTSSLADVLEFLAECIAFFGGAGIIGYVTYVRADSRDGLLLWLRRFHESYETRVRFHRPLTSACSGMLHPMTIQDSSFRASYFSGVRSLWAVVLFLPVIWAIVCGLLLFALFSAGINSGGAVLVVLITWTLVLVWLVLHHLKRAGVTKIDRGSARVEAGRIFDSVSQGKSTAGGLGFNVLKCDDNTWKEVVTEAIRRANVVLIDISEPTDNIYWEISEALNHLAPDAIIFAVEKGKDTDELFDEVFTHLRPGTPTVSKEWLREAALTYPAAQAPVGPGRNRQYSTLAKQLRREIARRVSQKDRRTPGRVSALST